MIEPSRLREDDRVVGSATFVLKTPEATREWGRALGLLLHPGDVLALIGDLGAGKTTLTQGIASGLGVRDDVTSPTFTLLHEYRGPTPLFHLDPYRLHRPEDLYDLGFEEYLARGGVMVIEWADRLGELLPTDRLTLTIEIAPDDAGNGVEDKEPGEVAPRQIDVMANGHRHTELLKRFQAAWEQEMGYDT